ncbi:MAG: hypothetical protein A2Z57_00165 [Planctomycetes bacterium RIFCSPHIGHO2_12_39_6]|nr:MAG: hypothetical protein A2Z57_00165 [Planctomycetes bacterium RIFCSPHIGHO2_12_39_6]
MSKSKNILIILQSELPKSTIIPLKKSKGEDEWRRVCGILPLNLHVRWRENIYCQIIRFLKLSMVFPEFLILLKKLKKACNFLLSIIGCP